MLKALIFLSTLLLAVASAGGYLVLNEKIIAGEKAIADGQNTIALKSPALEAGKADLARGKHLLSDGKKEYERAHSNPFLVFVDKWFNAGKGFAEGRKKIAAGEEKVAQGEVKVDVGEKRLDEGNLALQMGREKLQQSQIARDVCAFGALVFSLSSFVLGFFWRQSLLQFVRQMKIKSWLSESG